MTDSTKTLEEVCSLDELQLQDRLKFIRCEIAPHVVARQPFDGGLAWEFESLSPLREKLDWLVAQERRCCGGWGFEVLEVPGSRRLRLEVRGAASDSGLLELFGGPGRSETRESPESKSRSVGRACKAGAVGLLGSFSLFCVLPIAIAAIAGKSMAALPAALDNPVSIGAGALFFGALAWWFQRRRSDSSPFL